MEVICPACAARYTADEEKIRGRTARMRCRACDTVWLVGGEEEDPTNPSTDEPRASVRRGADREKRDLFAHRPSDHGYVGPTIPPPPMPQATTAARNESSVLFTLDSLRGSARVKTPEPAPSPISVAPVSAAAEDDGIIDLKALASMPPKSIAPRAPAAPLFSEPPPGAFAVDATGENARTGEHRFPIGLKKIGIIAGAAAATLLLVVGIASAFKGEEPVARNAVFVPPPPAAAAASPDPTPDPAPGATTDDAKSPTVGTSGHKKGHHGFAARGGVATFKKGSSDAAVSKPPPVKAADPCGCHGDFNCILRCTAKGK
jgi:predicted Zn finger-like uncharacterized protein